MTRQNLIIAAWTIWTLFLAAALIYVVFFAV